ncbi:hypothetical protein B0H19DRAFT_1235453 [Mycena capillaripes]|nr:hypothetical protein B0H19DRAFT_1235453 [Mycena capillaripes]
MSDHQCYSGRTKLTFNANGLDKNALNENSFIELSPPGIDLDLRALHDSRARCRHTAALRRRPGQQSPIGALPAARKGDTTVDDENGQGNDKNDRGGISSCSTGDVQVDLERGYINYARARILIEKTYRHPNFRTELTKQEREDLAVDLKAIHRRLTLLNRALVDRFNCSLHTGDPGAIPAFQAADQRDAERQAQRAIAPTPAPAPGALDTPIAGNDERCVINSQVPYTLAEGMALDDTSMAGPQPSPPLALSRDKCKHFATSFQHCRGSCRRTEFVAFSSMVPVLDRNQCPPLSFVFHFLVSSAAPAPAPKATYDWRFAAGVVRLPSLPARREPLLDQVTLGSCSQHFQRSRGGRSLYISSHWLRDLLVLVVLDHYLLLSSISPLAST